METNLTQLNWSCDWSCDSQRFVPADRPLLLLGPVLILRGRFRLDGVGKSDRGHGRGDGTGGVDHRLPPSLHLLALERLRSIRDVSEPSGTDTDTQRVECRPGTCVCSPPTRAVVALQGLLASYKGCWPPTRAVGLLQVLLASYKGCWPPTRAVGLLQGLLASYKGCSPPTRAVGILQGLLASYKGCWPPTRAVGLLQGLFASYKGCWSPTRAVVATHDVHSYNDLITLRHLPV